MFRFTLLFISSILTIEIILQLLAFTINPHGSYLNFYNRSLEKIAAAKADKTIFFVGDSTIFGGGASDEKLFSLPAQFAELLKRHDSFYSVLNLGYPGTTGKEHIEILRSLPNQSTVILRTGINDSWKRSDNFKISINGNYYEIRLLKLGMIFWFGWNRDNNSNTATEDYYKELETIAKSKNLIIYFVDYFLGETTFMNTYFKNSSYFIPMAKILKNEGFFDQNGFISKKYLSFDLIHANDIGYRLQAQTLFNWFSSKKKFNLKPSSKIDIKVDKEAISKLHENLAKKYKIFIEKNGKEELFVPLMQAVWQYYLITGDYSYKRLHESLEKVLIFAYHKAHGIEEILGRQQRMKTSEHYKNDDSILPDHEIDHWFKVLAAVGKKSNDELLSEYSDLSNLWKEPQKLYSDFSNLRKPFPLQNCAKFLRETGLSAKEININEDWKVIFKANFDQSNVHKENLKFCE